MYSQSTGRLTHTGDDNGRSSCRRTREKFPNHPPERLVHEGINEWIDDIVEKVKVKEEEVERDKAQRHQPARQKYNDEGQGNNKQRQGRPQIGHERSLRTP